MTFLRNLRGLTDPQLTEAMEAHDLQRPRAAIWMDEAALGIGRQCVRWSELDRVVAFKPDLPAIDLPCLYLESADGTSLEVHETAAGWEALLDALPDRVPGCSAVRAVLDALVPGSEAVVVERR